MTPYNGNQLQHISDAAGKQDLYNIKEYNPNDDGDFYYDPNGNLKADLDRKILSIKYNLLNLPSEITFEDGHSITNIYTADGRKLKSMYRTKIYGVLDPTENTLIRQRIVGGGGAGNNGPIVIVPKNSYYYEGAGTHYLGNIEYKFDIDRSNESQPVCIILLHDYPQFELVKILTGCNFLSFECHYFRYNSV